MVGMSIPGNVCVKPMDLFYLFKRCPLYGCFDKFVWLARDPRDAYLSAVESGFAYLFWTKGQREQGIDLSLLRRWKRIYRQFTHNRQLWYLVRYEELVTEPERVLRQLLDYLDLPYEKLYPFERFKLRKGGDPKLRKTSSVHSKSIGRYQEELSPEQLSVFQEQLGEEMQVLGYG
jgi:hypothetical protein